MPTPQIVHLLEELFECIHPERIDAIAKETGFIVRKRSICASDFLAMLFQFHGNVAECSLQELCVKLYTKQEISVSRTAIDKKFSKEAVLFLQRLVQELMLQQRQIQFPSLSLAESWPFVTMRIMDATGVSVPDHLKKRVALTRQTSGKIQHEYDFLTGQTLFSSIDFRQMNDTKMGAKRIPYLEEQELCMQDLGYFSFQQFEKMKEYKGFFISKLRNDAYLAFKNPFPSYHPNGKVVESSQYQRINLVALCEQMEPGECLELEGVHFGRDAHFPARCIIFAHDEVVKERRIKKIERRANKSRKQPKQVVRKLARITVYMTNLPDSVSAEQVVDLYRLRWQIELQFKVWKDYLDMDHFKVMKRERWLCHLYASLLVVMISQLIAHQLRNMIWEEKKMEISEMVAVRTIATEGLAILYEIYRRKKKSLKDYLLGMTRLLIKTARKPNSRKGTAFQRLLYA